MRNKIVCCEDITGQIKSIFGSETNSLVNYVKNLYTIASDTDDTQYVMLMCRRMPIICEIVHHYNFPEIKGQHIVYDDDLSPLKNHVGSQVLVADDILIHGRTAMRMYCRLEKDGYKPIVSAFFIKYNAEKLNPKVFKALGGRAVTELEWKDLSNRIIEFIIKSKIPYATFTYSFVTQKNNALDFNRRGYEHVSAFQEKIFKNCGVDLTVHFDVSLERYRLLYELCSQACIREYRYNDGSTVFIPFIVISIIKNKTFDSLSQNICLPQSVRDVFASSAHGDYKARLLSFLLGYAYGKVTLDVDNQKEKLANDKMAIIDAILSKSFTGTFKDIVNLSVEQCEKILAYSVKENEEVGTDEDFEQVSDISEFFFDFKIEDNQRDMSQREIINDALSKLHNENEKLSNINNKEHLYVYKLYDIINSFKKSKLFVGLTELISLWDIGRGGYGFRECGNFVYAVIGDGEQVYRIQDQKFKPYAKPYFVLRKYNLTEAKDEYFDFILRSPIKNHLPKNFTKEFKEAESYLRSKPSTELEIIKSLDSTEWEDGLYNQTIEFITKKYEEVIE